MLGTHDTMTYLQPYNPLFRLFTRLWRTQDMTIDEQYKAGVRFFDLRVCRHCGKWYFAHGLARLKGYKFATIPKIAEWMNDNCPDAFWRLVLERGSKRTEKTFMQETTICSQSWIFHNLWLADIKSHKKWNGEVLNRSFQLTERGLAFATAPNTWTPPCHELHGTVTATNILTINLKASGTDINDSLNVDLADLVDSTDEMYLLDYV